LKDQLNELTQLTQKWPAVYYLIIIYCTDLYFELTKHKIYVISTSVYTTQKHAIFLSNEVSASGVRIINMNLCDITTSGPSKCNMEERVNAMDYNFILREV
jgi:hypothetical protein